MRASLAHHSRALPLFRPRLPGRVEAIPGGLEFLPANARAVLACALARLVLTLANVAPDDRPRNSAHDTARLSTVPRDFDSPAVSGSRQREGSRALLQAVLDEVGTESPTGQTLARVLAEHQREIERASSASNLGTVALVAMVRRSIIALAAAISVGLPSIWHGLGVLTGSHDAETLDRIETTQNALVEFVVSSHLAEQKGEPQPDIPAALMLVTYTAAAAAERDTTIGH